MTGKYMVTCNWTTNIWYGCRDQAQLRHNGFVDTEPFGYGGGMLSTCVHIVASAYI